MIDIENNMKAILLNLDKSDLAIIDMRAEKGGITRTAVLRHLVHGVLNLDCKPSEYEPLKNAFERNNFYEKKK